MDLEKNRQRRRAQRQRRRARLDRRDQVIDLMNWAWGNGLEAVVKIREIYVI